MKLFKTTFIYKLLYLTVIFALLFINFSRKKTDVHNLNGLEVIETYSIKMPLIPKKIKSLELNHKGLSFKINYINPISITSDDDITRKSHLKNIEVIDDALQINLKNNVTLFFKVDNEGERFTISSDIPKVFPSIKEVAIPFEIKNSYNIEITDLSYKIFNEDDEFHLKLNDNYVIDKAMNYIRLFAENDKVSTLTFSPLNAKQLQIAEKWYMKYRDTEIEPVEDSISSYLAKAEKNIIKIYDSIRYLPDTETWENLPGRNDFSEDGALIYLASSLRDDQYKNSYNKIKALKEKFPQKFGFKSSPYLGDLIVNGSNGTKADLINLSDIQKLISKSDSKLLTLEIPEHYYTGRKINTAKLETFINNTEKKDLNLNQLYTSLYNLLKILETGSKNSESSNSIKEITGLIINKIKWDDTGLYLVGKDDRSSQFLNLKIGLLLIKAVQHDTSEYSKPVGEALVDTFIKNSNSSGIIKRSYNLKTKSFSSAYINPEEIYMSISDNPYLPHYYQEEGIKIWTLSSEVKVEKRANETVIEIFFPVNNIAGLQSHHMVVSGITPYKQLYYRGQQWRAAKDFEKWKVGYYYDLNNQLLYFMPKQKRSKEKIVVTY